MARPRAIFASIPPNELGQPKWDAVLGTIPVEYGMPYPFWPDLDWSGNVMDENGPAEYGPEHPKYLWSHPLVQDPVHGESHIFIRQWLVGNTGGIFDQQTIPADDLIFVVNHAADNQYALALVVGGVEAGKVQHPKGANTFIPSPDDAWRNVKTFFFHVNLSKIPPGTPINLITEAVNAPQIPNGTIESNPAMFTWVMYVFDNPA
jgi:hypothetical protein